jgi:hypothetical protein
VIIKYFLLEVLKSIGKLVESVMIGVLVFIFVVIPVVIFVSSPSGDGLPCDRFVWFVYALGAAETTLIVMLLTMAGLSFLIYKIEDWKMAAFNRALKDGLWASAQWEWFDPDKFAEGTDCYIELKRDDTLCRLGPATYKDGKFRLWCTAATWPFEYDADEVAYVKVIPEGLSSSDIRKYEK